MGYRNTTPFALCIIYGTRNVVVEQGVAVYGASKCFVTWLVVV